MKARFVWLLLGAMLLLAACGTTAPETDTEGAATEGADPVAETSPQAGTDALPTVEAAPTQPLPELDAEFTTTDSGLQYRDVVEGEGEEAGMNDKVTVNYTGWLEDGTQFDSSVGGNPFPVTIGLGSVIPGWEEGLQGMKPGGTRVLIIPSELGYGEQGSGEVIPPDANLVFEIEMLTLEEQPTPAQVDSYEELEDGSRYAVLEEGAGESASEGQLIELAYNAWFSNGVLFANTPQGEPVQFRLGQSGVPGLDEAIVGMQIGETRQIVTPENEAAVAQGAPEGETTFEVTLLDAVETPVMEEVESSAFAPTDNGVQIAVVEEGEGPEAQRGDTVTVNYSGFLEDGTIFDSSVESGVPYTFALAEGTAIPGWVEGIEGMQVGERRQIRIPPDLAYGEQGIEGIIPPNSTLVFDVALLELEAASGDATEAGTDGAATEESSDDQ